MKSIAMSKTVQFDDDIKQLLTKEVKETLAKDAIVINNKRNFTALDMWNHHRNSRSASDMMRRWNLD